MGFSIDVPYPNCPTRVQYPGNGAANYDFHLELNAFRPAIAYSVEWVSRIGKPALSESEVADYFRSYIPEYLSKNFGAGKYESVFYEPIRLAGQFPAVVVVGTGHHRNGTAGSIYLVAAYAQHHWAMIYSINSNTVASDDPSLSSLEALSSLPAFANFRRFANTFDLEPRLNARY